MSAECTNFLTENEAAEFVRLRPRTLRKYRECGTGPRYYLAGRRALYIRGELVAWLEQSSSKYQERREAALGVSR